MSDRQIEMFWRCSNCTHRNLGRHAACQSCKNAKDGSEQYEMPEDTASAVSVTEAALLRMALAGPNWRCAYCDSDQRAFDSSCKNCGAAAPARKGAPRDPKARKTTISLAPDTGTSLAPDTVKKTIFLAPDTGKKPFFTPWRWLFSSILIGFVAACCCVVWIDSWRSNRRKAPATASQAVPAGPEWTRALQVKDVSWEHTVTVDRYHQVEHEGFAEDRPEGALQVRARGLRHHHDDQVPDGYKTVSYTEQRQSGYTTETYQAKEACGQDCTTTPETCRENCTSNRNGFATCRTTCTGGGRRCTPRYCSVTKTRQEPRYVDVQLSREEPRFRAVPRDAQWYAWKEWTWTFARTVKASGTTLETRWPSDAELHPAASLPVGEKERHARSAKYTVVFHGEGQPPVTYTPETVEEFQRFAMGSTHTLQKDRGKVSVVPVK